MPTQDAADCGGTWRRSRGGFGATCVDLCAAVADAFVCTGGRPVEPARPVRGALLDATPITIRDPRADWAEADARTRGLKLHIGYEPRAQALGWLLLRLFRSRMAPAGHAKSLLIRLNTAILAPFNLTNHAKPPPRKPGTTAPSPQFALALTA